MKDIIISPLNTLLIELTNENTSDIIKLAIEKKINEIGDISAKSYNYTLSKDNQYITQYEFITDSDLNYIVKFEKSDDIADVLFYVKNLEPSSGSYFTTITNRGELFKVMSTIVKIIIEFLDKNSTNILVIEPSKQHEKDTQRFNLYMQYVKNVIDYKKYNVEFNSKEIIISRKINTDEGIYKQIKENISYSKYINIEQKIIQLMQYVIDEEYNIESLPKVEFINNDIKNAQNFLGKTAYYNPDTQTIFLYTEGRHPRDIISSFCHELVHHIQNLEGRLGNISTENVLEDNDLEKLEREAYENGGMILRTYKDFLKRQPNKINNIEESSKEKTSQFPPEEKIQFYKKYFSNISPSIFDISIEDNKIIIEGFNK
jgi:hypothetical protein